METSAATTHVLPQHLVSRLECKQGAVRAVRFNVDGQYCITCGSDKSVKLWNPKRNLLLKVGRPGCAVSFDEHLDRRRLLSSCRRTPATATKCSMPAARATIRRSPLAAWTRWSSSGR